MSRRRINWGPVIVHAVLLAATVVMLIPMAWMLSTSLKESGLTLSRGVQWLPWKDVWTRNGVATDVITLKARVRIDGAVHEVGVKSLGSRNQHTPIYLPDGRFDGEILEFEVRPLTDDETTAAAVWVPYQSLHRKIAPCWRNYREALQKMGFWSCLLNTLAITFLGTSGTILSCSLVGYGFARFRFPGRDALFLVLLSSMMLPHIVTMIPVYLLFREFHWIDTLLPLFFPAWFGLNAFAVFLFRQYYMTLPFDLDDAARIDGCSVLGIYWHVLLPLAKPVIATVGIFCFTAYWLDFMGPLIYLNTIEKFTLALGLYTFKGAYNTQWNYLMAATLVVSLPCILLFLLGQRFFIKGVVMSGIKG